MLPYPRFGSSLRRWGAGRGQLGEGVQALVGSLVSVWVLHKGMERLYARHCHIIFFLGDFRHFDTLKVALNLIFSLFSKETKQGLVSVILIAGDLHSTDFLLRKELTLWNTWLLSFTSVWEGWLQVSRRLESCWELSHAWCLLDHDWPDEALSGRNGVFLLPVYRCCDIRWLYGIVVKRIVSGDIATMTLSSGKTALGFKSKERCRASHTWIIPAASKKPLWCMHI